MDEIIRLEHISKRFTGVTALSDVSIAFSKGEVHALVGENGAGKSTLIKILLGAHQPTEGKIYFEGKETVIENPEMGSLLGIEGVHQELMLVPYLSVSGNIFLNREKKKKKLFDIKGMNERSRELLGAFSISIDVTKPVKNYSASIWKMIDIARVINQDPKLIIFDEPTAILSEREVECLFENIRRLKEKGIAIVYISHRLNEIGQIADKVTVLRDGHLIGTRDAEGLGNDELVKMMVGRDVSKYYCRTRVERGRELIKLDGLSLKKGQKDISLSVHEGEIVGLAGLVGSGRSEVAEAILGINPVLSGSIEYKGKEFHPKSPSDGIKKGIYLVPENRKYQGLILRFSVANNIALSVFGRWSRFFYKEKEESLVASREIKKLSIKTPSEKQAVRNLSGGNQQKVVIGKALETNAELLIFDEPSVGVDVGAKEEIHNHMDSFVASGGGILMISSDLPEVVGMCDRVYVMYEGRIVKELSVCDVSDSNIAEYMLGSKKGEDA